jgi:hypothetical protein
MNFIGKRKKKGKGVDKMKTVRIFILICSVFLFCVFSTRVYGTLEHVTLPDGRIKYSGWSNVSELDTPAIKTDGTSATYFKVKEFFTDTSVTEIIIAPKLVDILDSVRTSIGQKVVITSGYEPSHAPEYPDSAHRYGLAVDITSEGYNSYELGEELYWAGSRGTGTYFNSDDTIANYAHGDIRGLYDIPDCAYSTTGDHKGPSSWVYKTGTRDDLADKPHFKWDNDGQPYEGGTPEPATLILLGLGSLALLRRRRG